MDIKILRDNDGNPVVTPEQRQDILDWCHQLEKEHNKRQAIWDAMGWFDPDIHVIVTKEQLDLTNQLKTLSKLADMEASLQTIKEDVEYIKRPYVKTPRAKSKKTLSKEEEKLKIKASLLRRL